MKKLFWILILAPSLLHAQIGGRNVFDFLNLSQSARISALGGMNISTRDDDANLAWQNPALLSDSMNGYANVSIYNYISDISFGNFSYARTIGNIGTFHSGIQYINYGKFAQADEYGNINGSYRASDLALVAGFARGWKQFTYGTNLKLLYSNLATYNATGLALDLGGTYRSKDELFCAGIVFKNIGVQLSKYTPTANRAPLPFQIQAGLSYKLQYMPMRISITTHHLETPNMIYIDPDKAPDLDFNGEPIPPKKKVGHKIASHFVVGTEFYLGKNLRLRAGYNHQRRYELRAVERAGLTGFSMGLGLKVVGFKLDYGFVRYAAGMNTHHFSVATNLGRFKKKG